MLTDRRRNALTFCSSLAIATALAAVPQIAGAQSFQGSSTVVAGSATVTTGTNTTTVTVQSPQAVINWNPTDTATSPGTPINFQPAGTTATFQSPSDFAVLNRILPADASRPVVFNGTVISQLQSASATTPGGTVYFYSPGGILVGASAVFNVGNLGLTTLDPVIDGNGNWYNGNVVQFQQGSNASMVNIQPGAQITATQSNSYVALVAPSVQNNGGAISVNGSAALVAAEAATITFSPDGLFDIQVDVGTSAETYQGSSGNTALANSGSITGPAGTAGSDNHRVYLVAVPKNQMLAHVIVGSGSAVGFDLAGAADVDGNAIVLSAGYDIVNGALAGPSAAGSGGGRIQIDNSALTSAVTAKATDTLFAIARAGTLSFASDASLSAANTAAILGSDGGTVTVGGNLVVSADRSIPISGASSDAGLALFDLITGSSATVAGGLTLSANAFTDGDGNGKVTGGTAQVSLSDSSLSVGGNAVVRAQGLTNGSSTPIAAQGGSAALLVNDAGSVTVGGVTRIRSEAVSSLGANAAGGQSTLAVFTGSSFTTNQLNVSSDADGLAGGPTANPGMATGGSAVITVSGANSTLTVQAGNSVGNGSLGERDLLSAEAFAGDGLVVGGTAQGGNASFNVTNGAIANLPIDPGAAGFNRMFARAYGGDTLGAGGTGGSATGGTVSLNINGGTLNAGNLILPSSFALGGSASAAVTGAANGGNAFGGQRNVNIVNGTLNGSFAGGGPGAQGGSGSLTGIGGNGTGGTANFFMDNGKITAATDAFGIARVVAFAQNAGGLGMVGGNATGGVVNATIKNNSAINATGAGSVVAFNSFNTTPDATSAGVVSAGDAAGGTVNVSISNSLINAGEFSVYSNGLSGSIMTSSGAGASAHAGNALGGFARLSLNGATINAGIVGLGAAAQAGSVDDINAANGGNAIGGTAQLIAQGGASSINATAGLEIDSSASGGAVFSGLGNGGNASGGFALLQATGGATLTVTAPTVVVNVDSSGGFAAGNGNGGNATAGSSRVIVNNGTMMLNGDLEVDGGASGGDGVNGGAGFGSADPNTPNAFIGVNNGTLTVDGFTALDGDINGGNGRDGGNGGNAGSGFAQIFAGDNNGSGLRGLINLQDALIEASSNGGSASGTGNGGNAAGGRAWIFVDGGDIAIAGSAELEAAATGGDGLNGGNAISLLPQRQPRALIGSFNGTVDIGGTALLTASAFGGNAAQPGGGRGGIALAGSAGIDAQSQNGPSEVSVGGLFIDVNATGGFGGEGLAGQAGGAGGEAYGGNAFAQGNAGRGVLNVNGDTFIIADAHGGSGGLGGIGNSSAAGGNGGAGGRAIGGGFSIGTVSGFDTPVNLGSANFGQVIGSAQAYGGAGGDGGSGTTQGNGGNGGVAFGGFTGILVRGSPATFGNVVYDASGHGGDGGSGTVGGNGGDGYAGDLSVVVTQRFNRTERGSLTAGNLSLFAGGYGGSGATAGRSFYSAASGTENGFFIRQSDVALNSVALFTTGDLAPNVTTTILQVQDSATGIPVPTQVTVAPEPFDINVSQSTVNIASGFLASTPGNMLVSLDRSTFNVANLTLDAGNFVLPAARPATLGTFNVTGNFDVSSGLDFLAYANFNLAGGGIFDSHGSVLTGDLTSNGSLDITAAGSITTGAVDAVSVFLEAGTSVTAAAITSDGALSLSSNGAIATGDLAAGGTTAGAGRIAIASTSGPVSTGKVRSTGNLDIQTNGFITTGSVAAANVFLAAGQGITAMAIDSGGAIYLSSLGAITAGDLAAGGTSAGAGKIAIGSASGPVSVGALRSTGDLGIQTGGSVAAGNLIGRDVLLLTGGSLTTGSILAASGSQANGAIYFGNSSMVSDVVSVYQPFRGQTGLLPIFQATPVAIGGSATFGGSIQGGSLVGAAQGALTAQAITAASYIGLRAGGVATVNGAWRAPDIELVSGDIAISQTGSLDALSADGTIFLGSTNPAGVIIGDGQSGSGYTLDNGEFSRLKAGEIGVIGIDGPQSTDMTIGNLSIAGSQLYGANGTVVFATGDSATETPGGILRIAGAVNATGFAPANEIDLLSGTVEIEAVNGSLKVTDGTNNLGGLVYIEADRIHVASDAILTKLRADPLYAGHITDLNTAPAVARPDGVLNALGLELYPTQTLYVQNTGTGSKPAGFLTVFDKTEVVAPHQPPTGGVEVVINGQFQTSTGTLTGRAASDLVQANAKTETDAFAGFSSTSQLNGCLFLGGACAGALAADPVASISSEITVVTGAALDDSPTAPTADDADEGEDGSSEDKDEDDDGDPGASPIAPPTPLINTRQLNPNVNVVEPVSGAGNPALLGSAVNEDTAQGDEK